MEYEERTIHHPFGLGLMLHTQFVREVIEQVAKQAASDSNDEPESPKSPQATRDGVSSSAFADYVISPACLSWTLR